MSDSEKIGGRFFFGFLKIFKKISRATGVLATRRVVTTEGVRLSLLVTFEPEGLSTPLWCGQESYQQVVD